MPVWWQLLRSVCGRDRQLYESVGEAVDGATVDVVVPLGEGRELRKRLGPFARIRPIRLGGTVWVTAGRHTATVRVGEFGHGELLKPACWELKRGWSLEEEGTDEINVRSGR